MSILTGTITEAKTPVLSKTIQAHQTKEPQAGFEDIGCI